MEKKKEAVAVSSAAAEVTAVTPKVKRRSIVEFISDTLSPPEKTKTKTAVKTGKEEKKKGETDGDKVKKKKKKKKRRSIVEVVAGTIKSAVAAAEERSAREKAADRITIEAELRAKLLKRHDSMNGELSSSKKTKKSKKKKNRKAVLRNTHTKKDTRKTQLQEREADAEGVEERAAAAGAQKGKRDPNATASLVETAAQLGSLTAELLPADSDVTQSAWSDSE